MKTIVLGVLLCLFLSSKLWAQEIKFNTDRPGISYTATTVDKGYLQLESGFGLDLLNHVNSWTFMKTDLRYGLFKNFELRSGFQLLGLKHRTSDLALTSTLKAGLKWQVVNKKVQLAYLAEILVPIHPTIVNAHHLLQMSHGVGKKVSFNYLLLHRYDFSRLGAEHYGGDLQLAYAVRLNLLPRWSFFLELSAQWSSLQTTQVAVLYDTGLTFLIKDNLQFDIFFGHGINYKQGTYGLGICWLPPKINKK